MCWNVEQTEGMEGLHGGLSIAGSRQKAEQKKSWLIDNNKKFWQIGDSLWWIMVVFRGLPGWPWFTIIVYYHLTCLTWNDFVVLSKTNTKTAEVVSFGDSRLLCGAWLFRILYWLGVAVATCSWELLGRQCHVRVHRSYQNMFQPINLVWFDVV